MELTNINTLINSLNICQEEKEMLMAEMKAIQKNLIAADFKFHRTTADKTAITNVLNASIEEIEKQKKLIEEAGIQINRTLLEIDLKNKIVEEKNEQLNELLKNLTLRTQEIERQKKLLETEKSKSDILLLNILPEEIASELKRFGKSFARKHDAVSVLFADIAGFTTIAQNMNPDLLVSLLDETFRGFDYIAEKYGLEKIKTVGDCYMCAAGLPVDDPDHAVNAIRTAADMQLFVQQLSHSRNLQDLPEFKIRIGIHSGSVVAGVVGTKKFVYDIWGNTVNLSSQMEQCSEPGRINISGDTYELVKAYYTCHHRGKIRTKNNSEIDMYFVDEVE